MSSEQKQNTAPAAPAKGTAVPSLNDLQSLLDNARQSAGTKLQYAWNPPGGTKSYRLVVVVEDDQHDPKWSLKVIEGIEAREVWNEEISDLAVVRDVCLRHSPNPQARPAATPPTGSPPTVSPPAPSTAPPAPQRTSPPPPPAPAVPPPVPPKQNLSDIARATYINDQAPTTTFVEPPAPAQTSPTIVAQSQAESLASLPPLPPPIPPAIHLAKVDDFKYAPEPSSELQALGEDGTGAEYLNTQLTNATSGFYEYASILKFLEHEFYRFEAFGIPCSLIIFDMLHKDPLSTDALTVAGLRISMMGRRVDRVGHFETHFALLLPATTQAAGGLIATRVLGALSAAPLAPGFDKSTIKFSFGVSGLPEDGASIENLIIAAKLANNSARSLPFPVCVSGGT